MSYFHLQRVKQFICFFSTGKLRCLICSHFSCSDILLLLCLSVLNGVTKPNECLWCWAKSQKEVSQSRSLAKQKFWEKHPTFLLPLFSFYFGAVLGLLCKNIQCSSITQSMNVCLWKITWNEGSGGRCTEGLVKGESVLWNSEKSSWEQPGNFQLFHKCQCNKNKTNRKNCISGSTGKAKR